MFDLSSQKSDKKTSSFKENKTEWGHIGFHLLAVRMSCQVYNLKLIKKKESPSI